MRTDATEAPLLDTLPAAYQRELPPFRITGYLYAASRSERSLLIDNRLVHEGDQIAPGVTLLDMQPGGAVFRFRGQRFRLAYR